MIKKVFTVFDRAVEAYTQPFFANTYAESLRFIDATLREDNNLSRHPEDYTVYCVAEWDDTAGEFENIVPQKVADVLELHRKIYNKTMEMFDGHEPSQEDIDNISQAS